MTAHPARSVDVDRPDGAALRVDVAGSGPALLLLHGFPHTRAMWRPLVELLADRHTLVAPDLRGLGESTPGREEPDAATVAADGLAVLDALRIDEAVVVGTDLGALPAFLLAHMAPERIDGLVLFEGLLGALPGAERFLAGGPPWWFGFHAVPGLAERVAQGNEAAYIDFFLRNGTATGEGVDAWARDAFVAAYARQGALARALAHYRAMPASGAQVAAAAERRLPMPALAIAGGVVGEAVADQLEPVAAVRRAAIADAGHLVALEQPEELARLLAQFALDVGAR